MITFLFVLLVLFLLPHKAGAWIWSKLLRSQWDRSSLKGGIDAGLNGIKDAKFRVIKKEGSQ